MMGKPLHHNESSLFLSSEELSNVILQSLPPLAGLRIPGMLLMMAALMMAVGVETAVA